MASYDPRSGAYLASESDRKLQDMHYDHSRLVRGDVPQWAIVRVCIAGSSRHWYCVLHEGSHSGHPQSQLLGLLNDSTTSIRPVTTSTLGWPSTVPLQRAELSVESSKATSPISQDLPLSEGAFRLPRTLATLRSISTNVCQSPDCY